MLKKKKRAIEDDPYRTNSDRVREKMKQTEGDTRWWKPKNPGKYLIRVLPPWGKAAEGVYYYTAALHYNFDIGGQNRAIPCLKTHDPPMRCFVCDFIIAIKSQGNEEMMKLVEGSRHIRPKRKYWVNIIDRKNPNEVKMFGSSRKFVEFIDAQTQDEDYGDVTDPTDGYDIKVTRVGTGFTDTRYSFSVSPRPSPIGLIDWKSKLHKLDKEVIEWIPTPEVAKILKANYGEEMAEVGFKIVIPGKSKKNKAQEDEDNDEETEDESDGEDDDRKRSDNSGKSRKVAKSDEEDDEEDDESKSKDDEDEDSEEAEDEEDEDEDED